MQLATSPLLGASLAAKGLARLLGLVVPIGMSPLGVPVLLAQAARAHFTALLVSIVLGSTSFLAAASRWLARARRGGAGCGPDHHGARGS